MLKLSTTTAALSAFGFAGLAEKIHWLFLVPCGLLLALAVFNFIETVGCGCGASCGASFSAKLNSKQRIGRAIGALVFAGVATAFWLPGMIFLRLVSAVAIWFSISFLVASLTRYGGTIPLFLLLTQSLRNCRLP